VTKHNPENCKNCSYKCAYDCAQLQYTIQHRTVLIISPLSSDRQHLSYDVCLEVRGEIIRDVICSQPASHVQMSLQRFAISRARIDPGKVWKVLEFDVEILEGLEKS